MPPRPLAPTTVARSPAIDPNVSRPISRRGAVPGLPSFHQAAAARPVAPGGAGTAARPVAPPELGGFGTARGVKRECVAGRPALPIELTCAPPPVRRRRTRRTSRRGDRRRICRPPSMVRAVRCASSPSRANARGSRRLDRPRCTCLSVDCCGVRPRREGLALRGEVAAYPWRLRSAAARAHGRLCPRRRIPWIRLPGPWKRIATEKANVGSGRPVSSPSEEFLFAASASPLWLLS
jgi:hypothetical protein